MLDAINRSADRIDRIMRELLDAQQIELGRFQVTIERVDVTDLVEDVVNRVGGASPNHRIGFSATERLTVFGDPERLREVMRILLDNAVRYSPGGGAIEVSVRRVDTGVEVAVRDHGVGIPRNRQGRVFQRFYRAHAGTPHDYGGTGLGLYVARTIIARHGGRIWFETEEDRGTTFSFRIPWRAADGAAG
jgi:signal transduction histidine kinase